MTAEKMTDLRANIIRGFTATRGNAWHFEASDPNSVANHYEQEVPLEVAREALGWVPLEGTIETTLITADGVTRIADPTRKSIVHPVTMEVLFTPKVTYTVHGYEQWLLDNVSTITAQEINGVGGLKLASVGQLQRGALAFAQFELPESIQTPEGVSFRPFITSATSINGKLASTYLTGNQVVECDNTLTAALGDKSHMAKQRHSKNSLSEANLAAIRDALGVMVAQMDDFATAVAELCATTVTDRQWAAFLDAHDATTLFDVKKNEEKKGRGKTNAENVREQLENLRRHDLRCSPWTGTAFGVLQTVNTWEHHVKSTRGEGSTKSERNALRMVTGGVDAMDLSTLATLDKVLASA